METNYEINGWMVWQVTWVLDTRRAEKYSVFYVQLLSFVEDVRSIDLSFQIKEMDFSIECEKLDS